MQGIIVYNKVDAERNWWFIDEMTRIFGQHEIRITLKIEEELSFENLPDFVIYRARNHQNIERFERLGVKVFNNSKTNEIANDKFLTYTFAKNLGLEMMDTTDNLDDVSSFPIVMKSVDGHGGKEVYLINSKEEANPLSGKRYIYQKACDELGVDLRVYVLGNEPKVAIKRTSNTDWRSNYSLGGHAEEVEIPEYVREIATIIASELKSDLIGIDFIRNNGKWILNEIEDPVGCRMVYHYSNYYIFEHFVSRIINVLGN